MHKIGLLCVVGAAFPLDAQTVNVWLTTHDQKKLLQPAAPEVPPWSRP